MGRAVGPAQTKQARALRGRNGSVNKIRDEDKAIHNWYRFVLSFPPHLVRHYLDEFETACGNIILDPFCGTGTTLVECKKRGIRSIGVEANAMGHFASLVKTDWKINPESLLEHAEKIAARALKRLENDGIADEPCSENRQPGAPLMGLPPETHTLLLANSISPLPLHKSLVLLECIKDARTNRFHHHELLAFAKAAVFSTSNLHFGPEVGVRSPKTDAAVVGPWMDNIRVMGQDLREYQGAVPTDTDLYHADARGIREVLARQAVDAVITSPPYPNEKDYTRTTRLESVLLGFLRTKVDLREMKMGLVRSNTRNVYKVDDDDKWIADNKKIQALAEEIEARRVHLQKTSGFERLYHRVTRLYFGGMARHLMELRSVLRPGAMLAYVVGDQASYLRVMIRTGQLLADIAQSIGYELVRVDLFRTRLATATREQLREEVVILRWPGAGGRGRRTRHTG